MASEKEPPFLLQPFVGCILNATDGFFVEKIVDSACNFAILVYSMCADRKGANHSLTENRWQTNHHKQRRFGYDGC